jgi:hypothetical protein
MRLGAIGGDEAAAVQLDAIHRRVVADLHAESLGAAVVGVDQRLAAAHEKGVGARQRAACPSSEWLEVHAVAAHPGRQVAECADHQARQRLVGAAAGDLEQVLPDTSSSG